MSSPVDRRGNKRAGGNEHAGWGDGHAGWDSEHAGWGGEHAGWDDEHTGWGNEEHAGRQVPILDTPRLSLRSWTDADLLPYTRLNADPRVMRYFPRVLSAPESRAQMRRLQAFLVAHGWGVWAVTLKSTGEFIGMTGLHAVEKDSGIPHAPLTEIAWRMLPDHWGRGYAPEAARRVMQFAFEVLALDAVHAFTATVNGPSRRVMTKIGMVDTGEVFDHPALPAGHVLQRHCLYVMTRARWERGADL